MEKDGKRNLSLKELVGGGYEEFWRFRGRYRVVKGSRASKKSKTTALWYIVQMMAMSQANLLVVRRTYRTLQDSCFRELQWAIGRLGVGNFWKISHSPLQMEYLPTGQKIYFRGLDDPLKVTSITVEVGHLCWMWVEEAFEIRREEDFSVLDESIRGAVPENLFKQVTLTFNPWSSDHWLKSRFFDEPRANVLAMTTNYLCNEWLDEDDFALFGEMRQRNPKRYQVAGLGDWGLEDGELFLREWMGKRFRDLPAGATLIQTWDLPFKGTERSAKCAGLVMARCGGEIFVLDCVNEHMDFVDSAQALREMTRKYPTAVAKVIEDKANGPALIDYLKKEISGMVSFHPRGSKEERALSISPYFEAGNVHFLEGGKFVDELVEDLVKFPNGRYKDTVDALVQGILYLTAKPMMGLGELGSMNKSSYWK